ncbi:two-component system chemotaxis response regulator CheB [Sphingomonas kaistensis]|uniref:protein-glutamate methylesterase n=1 Tax=Sphingomonas kaistensis TaxID=298708 RepID=A0A7X5Y5Y6_9SPHN|nr:chemotaxis protein CheB [Sphingomonas kaistensis]NJC05731.1 two-component system chemotaxis response regulator CheB [Sphingomonas kaistensis]
MSAEPVAAVVIGASAGAVQALSEILPRLPADYPLPVLVVVHVPSAPSGLTTLFSTKCAMAVVEPDDKEMLAPGTIYFAPPGYHLLVEPGGSVALSADEPVLYSRPSIDVLFESAADSFGPALLGIVLTGANEDGARGAAQIVAQGGSVLVEDPATAYAATMPAAALAHCPAARALSLDAICEALISVAAQ